MCFILILNLIFTYGRCCCGRGWDWHIDHIAHVAMAHIAMTHFSIDCLCIMENSNTYING